MPSTVVLKARQSQDSVLMPKNTTQLVHYSIAFAVGTIAPGSLTLTLIPDAYPDDIRSQSLTPVLNPVLN